MKASLVGLALALVLRPELEARAEFMKIVDGEFLAVSRPGVAERVIKRGLGAMGAAVEKISGSERIYFIRSPRVPMAALQSTELFDSLEANFIADHSMSEDSVIEGFSPLSFDMFSSLGLRLPNDPNATDYWVYDNVKNPAADISAIEAWGIRTSSDDLVIGVVDSGIDLNHPDLRENLWMNPGEIAGNGIDDDGNGYVDDVYGINSHTGESNPQDTIQRRPNMAPVKGHGTMVAGIIGAVGNNGLGGNGVLWKTKLMAIRADDGTGLISYSGAIKGCFYAAANGAKVINASWGTYTAAITIREMLNELNEKGVIVVNAVGNSKNDVDRQFPEYPASFRTPNLIAVTASNERDELIDIADFGYRSVHLAAPGWRVRTTELGGGYTSQLGTSFAAPFVTAAVAMVWAEFPELSHEQVKAKILASVDIRPQLREKTATAGRLNLFRALQP